MEIIELLQSYVDQGYLLHGSRHKCKQLNPRRKKHLNEKVGLLKAVYVTDEPLIAMFKAILRARKVPGKRGLYGWGFSLQGKPKFRISPNYIKYKGFSKGYLYVVEKKDFTKSKKIPHEFYCFKTVVPQKVIMVEPEDFLEKVKFSFWTKNEAIKTKLFTEEEITAMGY